MKKTITVDTPIPSCQIHELIYEEGTWKYVYQYTTPEELPLEPEEGKSFIVYGHISNLKVEKDDLNELSANIRFKTFGEYMDILETQRKADYDYRLSWLSRHPKTHINTVILENRSYGNEELETKIKYLSTILMEINGNTIFAAVK